MRILFRFIDRPLDVKMAVVFILALSLVSELATTLNAQIRILHRITLRDTGFQVFARQKNGMP